MAIIYDGQSQDVLDIGKLCMKVASKYHGGLVTAGLTIGILLATHPDGEPAVKSHGWPCAAKVKINSLKDRAEGKADATITIDHSKWQELSEAERVALLDHELTHLSLALDKNGKPKRDDLDRPKLAIVPHDYECGVFKVNIERHASNSLDYQHGKVFQGEFGQLLMWADEPAAVG